MKIQGHSCYEIVCFVDSEKKVFLFCGAKDERGERKKQRRFHSLSTGNADIWSKKGEKEQFFPLRRFRQFALLLLLLLPTTAEKMAYSGRKGREKNFPLLSLRSYADVGKA